MTFYDGRITTIYSGKEEAETEQNKLLLKSVAATTANISSSASQAACLIASLNLRSHNVQLLFNVMLRVFNYKDG